METTRHLTATVYVVNDGATALHDHARHDVRIPPGGHVERERVELRGTEDVLEGTARLAVGQDALKAGVEFSEAELTFIARNEIAVKGKDGERLLKLLDALEESDDVQKVHSTADIDEAVLAEAG